METFIKKELHYSLLFICLGNICRSPAADAVMHHLTETKGLSSNFTIDSAGIGSWHVGEFPHKSNGGECNRLITNKKQNI